MSRKIKPSITFPFSTQGMVFENIKALYDYYYSAPIESLTEFSRPFCAMGINLTLLVHSGAGKYYQIITNQ